MTAADFAFLPHHMHLAARRAARNMSLPLVCFTLMLMGCSQQEFRPPSGYALIASLRVTEDAFEGPTKRKNGTDFYLDKGSKDSGPSLLVYSFVNGRLAETLGGGIAPLPARQPPRGDAGAPFRFRPTGLRCGCAIKERSEIPWASPRAAYHPGRLEAESLYPNEARADGIHRVEPRAGSFILCSTRHFN